jgi:hypothetical protein
VRKCGAEAGMISGMAVRVFLGEVLDHVVADVGNMAGSNAGGSWGLCAE